MHFPIRFAAAPIVAAVILFLTSAALRAESPTTLPFGVTELTITEHGEIDLNTPAAPEPPAPLPLPPGVTSDQLKQPIPTTQAARWSARNRQQLRRWRAEHAVALTLNHAAGYTVQTDLDHKEIGPHVPTSTWSLAFYNGTQFVPLGDRSDDNTPDPLWITPDRHTLEARLDEHKNLIAASGFANPLQTATPETPATWVFRTAQGTLGLFRITKFIAAPKPQLMLQLKIIAAATTEP